MNALEREQNSSRKTWIVTQRVVKTGRVEVECAERTPDALEQHTWIEKVVERCVDRILCDDDDDDKNSETVKQNYVDTVMLSIVTFVGTRILIDTLLS